MAGMEKAELASVLEEARTQVAELGETVASSARDLETARGQTAILQD